MRALRAGLLCLLLVVVTACGSGTPAPTASTAPPTTIRFASYDFTENQILVEVYAEAARRAGLHVSVQNGVGTREVVAPALQQGVVDVVVDYLGTALAFARPTADLPRDPAEMHAVLSRGRRGVLALDVARAQDQNGFLGHDPVRRRERRGQPLGPDRTGAGAHVRRASRVP